jgi:hypothetical protein
VHDAALRAADTRGIFAGPKLGGTGDGGVWPSSLRRALDTDRGGTLPELPPTPRTIDDTADLVGYAAALTVTAQDVGSDIPGVLGCGDGVDVDGQPLRMIDA